MWLKLLCPFLKQPCAVTSYLAQKPEKRLLSSWRDQAGLGYRATQNFGHIGIPLVVVLWFFIYSLPNYRHGTQPQTWLVHLCFRCTNTYKWNKKPRKGFLILTAAEPLPSCTTSGFPSYNYGRTRSLILSHIWTFPSAEGNKVVLMRSQTIQMIRPEEAIVIIYSSLLPNTRHRAFLNYLIFEL